MDIPERLADLHRHLDGSLRMETLVELAGECGVPIPGDVRFYPGMGLAAALDRFRLTLAVLQTPEAVRRVAGEICEDAAAEGVSTLEIRFAPQLHGGPASQPCDPGTIVDAALDGIAGRAGLVLCVLYGEHPATADLLVDLAASRSGVTGLDLAGGPIAEHRFTMADYAPAFCRAKDLGLGRTVHAAEGRPPAEIRAAVELLHAQRIGHGTSLLDDPDVLDLVLERQVTIEACVTSNVQTGVVPGASAHPMPAWLRAGVRACICTDNTLFSDVDSRAEHRVVAEIPGMTEEMLHAAVFYGHRSAFGSKGAGRPSLPSGTRRQQIDALLRLGEHSFHGLRREMEMTVRELETELRHVERSTRGSGSGRFVVLPAECMACGFVFRDRASRHLHPPSRCPKCRSERLVEPRFRIRV